MMITEHNHGTFLITLDDEEQARLSALIEASPDDVGEGESPCLPVVAQIIADGLVRAVKVT